MLIPADPLNAFVAYRDKSVPHAADGPLAGLSFAVKDIFDVVGYPTGCGNPVKRMESPPAKANAPAVAKLLAAGARFVGKTHTAELAFSLDGRNSRDGTPVNPAAPGRVPGGSSSGSASAVAGGLCDIALGSDTGGSVRAPASFCGIIGLRPTYGRIDIGGAMPLAPSLDTVGWFTRDIDLYERVGAVLLGEDAAGAALQRMGYRQRRLRAARRRGRGGGTAPGGRAGGGEARAAGKSGDGRGRTRRLAADLPHAPGLRGLARARTLGVAALVGPHRARSAAASSSPPGSATGTMRRRRRNASPFASASPTSSAGTG